jgi:hypothetical protein
MKMMNSLRRTDHSLTSTLNMMYVCVSSLSFSRCVDDVCTILVGRACCIFDTMFITC